MKESTHHVDLSELLKTLPPVIPRKDIEHYLGGLISKGHMANLDSQGKGPKRFVVGGRRGRVAYLRSELVDWLTRRSQVE